MGSIHDLPVELLDHIFRCVSPSDRSDIRLAHVCRLWRAVLQKTPEFWGHFLNFPSLITQKHHERSVGFWYSFIDRTRRQPLRLRLEGGNFDLLQTILEHLPRLVSLLVQWRTANPKDVQRRLLALGPLPALEDLQLICDLPAPETNFLDLEAAGLAQLAPLVKEYPRLRHLEVNPDFFVPSMVVPSLTRLILHRGHMSFTTLIPALAQCPALRSLRINHVFFKNPLSTSPQVDLSRLRELCLNYTHYAGVRIVRHLLMHLKCPSMARLFVSLSSYSLVGLFPGPQPLPIMRALTELVVRVSDPCHDDDTNTYTLSIEGFLDGEAQDTPGIYLVNERIPWQSPDGLNFSPIHCIAYYFGFSTIKYLQFSLLDEQLNMSQADWTALFEAFPALVSLKVHITSCSTLLKALRHARLLLAKLEALTLECGKGSGIHHNLVVTLESRAKLGHRLQRLEFCHLQPNAPPFSDWHLARLRDVVAEVVVTD